jgi:hypothetical protein
MDKHEEQFQPESVEEQIKQYTQSTQQYAGSETPDERMIQDLQYVYTNYTQSGNRVWTRLTEHLAQQNNLHGINDANDIQIERSRSHLCGKGCQPSLAMQERPHFSLASQT